MSRNPYSENEFVKIKIHTTDVRTRGKQKAEENLSKNNWSKDV